MHRRKKRYYKIKTAVHLCVEMEVDKEPMDLNNSSRVSFATTELVDSLIFITSYFVSVISFSTSPQLHHTPFSISTLSNLFIFSHNASYIVPFANPISTSLKLSLVTIINASNFSHFSFHHFYTEFQALNLSIHICP